MQFFQQNGVLRLSSNKPQYQAIKIHWDTNPDIVYV